MTVLAVLSQKGGSGKSTLAINLAAAFGAQSQRVMILDADPQGSVSAWAAIGQDELSAGVSVRSTDEQYLVDDVREATQSDDWVIIDGPPRITRVMADAIHAADVVLIPGKAGPFDLWACPDLVEAVKASQEVNRGRPVAAFVVTMHKPRTMLGRHIDESLEAYDLPVLESRTTDRVAYPMMAIVGKSVFEGTDQVAQGEMAAMRDEIGRLLNGNSD